MRYRGEAYIEEERDLSTKLNKGKARHRSCMNRTNEMIDSSVLQELA